MQLARRTARRKAMRFMQDLSKARPCADCGGRFPAVAMDYDHRRNKQHNVSELVQFGTVKWSRAAAEIAKCDLVCSNCHRLRTFERKKAKS